MKISSLRQTVSGGRIRLSALVSSPARAAFELWIEYEGVPADWISADRYDAFFVAVFPAALRLGEDLECDGVVSSALVASGRGPIQDLWHSWFPDWRPIAVRASETPAPYQGHATGLFFSGGIDSFYTFLTQRVLSIPGTAITHWITVQGFDMKLAETTRFERVAVQNHRLAKEFGVNLVIARTNLREFSDAILGWDLYHGAALAALGLGLSGGFRRFFIASATGSQERWGSHPAMDPLWSNCATEFIHDRTGVPRLEKIRLVTAEPRALQALRVCWEHRSDADNCSRCEKCLRTMTSLDRLGMRAQSTTFDWTLYVPGLWAVVAPVRTLHHWRSLRRAYPWTIRGFSMKLILGWLEIHSQIWNALRVVKAMALGKKAA